MAKKTTNWLSRLFGRRSIEAASTDGINATWRPAPQTPSSIVAEAAGPLRNRSRDLYANDPHYSRAVNEYIHGLGSLEPRPATGDADLDKKIQALWDKWALGAFAAAEIESYDVGITTVVREWLVAGDGLILRHTDPTAYGVPLRLQALAADFLDDRKWVSRDTGQNRTVNGKELNKLGRTVAFWLYPEHPGDAITVLESVRVPLDRVAHVYSVKIPGQVSGIPELSNIISPLRDLKDYADAHIHRKVLESSFGPIIHDADPSTERYMGMPIGWENKKPIYHGGLVDSNGIPVTALDSGTAAIAPPGADITFPQPTTAPDFASVFSVLLHRVAAGSHVPYARIAADLSGYNFSSARIDQLPFKAVLAALKGRAAQQLSVRIWRWWVEAAVITGQIPAKAVCPVIKTVPYKIPAPAFQEADLDRMVTAVRNLIRIGGMSQRDAIEMYFGGDVDEIIAENAVDFTKAQAAGLVLDSNPAQTSLSGGVQPLVIASE